MVTQRILDYLATYAEDGPVLVVDLELVEQNMLEFKKSLPSSKIFYAVKANPTPEVLSLLASMGSNFDCASVPEIRMALTAGANPDQISYGNTIKKQKDIKTAYDLGVRLFAVDSVEEVYKLSVAAPGSNVFCRILTDGEGAEWPLSRKFGCTGSMALTVIREAKRMGLNPIGLSFHVGSQMTRLGAWDQAVGECKELFDILAHEEINLTLLNLGGGFPTRYTREIPNTEEYGLAIQAALVKYFGNNIPETIIEPGRGMVGNAGVIQSEVVLVSQKDADEEYRWVYLDIGKFSGLAETADESIRYPIRTERDHDELGPCVLAGPTCDSADVMYEKQKYMLPLSLCVGDKILIESTGVYTSTYSAVAFNGFAPLRTIVI